MIMKKTVIFLLLIWIVNCFSQTDHRNNFKQSFWENYVGIYYDKDNSTILISLAWGDKLVYTNINSRQFLTLSQQKDDVFISGDSLSITFQRNQSDKVTSMIFQIGNKEFKAEKREIKYELIKIPSDDETISGTLILPGENGPHPLIIINGGASWIIRDTNLDEALFYVSEGIAAFVYDKRGWGESTGNKTVPFQKTADDLKNIAEYFKFRMDIVVDEIGISTYSQSGWYGTLASSQSNVISFQVLNVPSATTVHRQERQRVKSELTVDGFNSNEIKNALELFDLMSTFSTTGKKWDEYIHLREKQKEKQWFKYLFAPPQKNKEIWEWGRMNWLYNPLPVLIKTTIPTLVILGEKDHKVLADVNRSVFENAFEFAGNKNYEIHIIPNMNHGLELAYKGGRIEPSRNLYAPSVFKIKKEWLEKVVK